MEQRESLLARVRQMRRLREVKATAEGPGRETGTHGALQERIEHLEELLEGLQDSVHRESVRQDARLAELEARTDPAALAAALSSDARKRGL